MSSVTSITIIRSSPKLWLICSSIHLYEIHQYDIQALMNFSIKRSCNSLRGKISKGVSHSGSEHYSQAIFMEFIFNSSSQRWSVSFQEDYGKWSMEPQNDSRMKARLSPQQLELLYLIDINMAVLQVKYFLGLHVLW